MEHLNSMELLKAPEKYMVSEKVVNEAYHLLEFGDVLNSVILGQIKIENADLMQLEGLGKDIWKAESPEVYIKRLRADWE